ncbi:hypothetical protein MKX03_027163 [Papaver bracteatum]|nr:hypothetical protein MKX03_027163 [Papaver bracteatum]
MESVQNQHSVNNNDNVALSSRFKWRIESVSKLSEENHFSPIFVLGPHKWGCVINGYLSAYVVAVECKNSRYAKFSLAVIDRTNKGNTLRKDTEDQMFQFTDDENDWGFDDLIELKELKDPSNGYIVNDVCIVEVEICLNSKLVPMESIEERDPVTSSTLLASTSCLDENSGFICAFCQSSKVSQFSGSMLRFANGKEVEEDELSGPNVIHVHLKCLMWAPRVYYAGETIKNLELELVRGSKLKCSCCGCSSWMLRTILQEHISCSLCIRDFKMPEGYLMLCPSHFGLKFPHEKTEKGKKLAKDNSSVV